MATKSVGVGAGGQWVARAVNLGGGNPGAIFGGAALFVATLVAVSLLLFVVAGLATMGMSIGSTLSLAVGLVLVLAILFVASCLIVGFLRLIDAAESGRPVTAASVLSGFGDLPASLKVFGLLLVMQVATNLLVNLVFSTLAPEMLAMQARLVEAMRAGQSTEQLLQLMQSAPRSDHAGLATGLTWIVMTLAYAVQAIGFGQIALNARGIGGAIADGLSGALRNALPLALLLAISVAGAILAGLGVFLLLLVVTLLAGLLGPWIAVVLGLPLQLLLALAIVVIAFGIMYHLWRDVCGAGDDARALPDDRVEL